MKTNKFINIALNYSKLNLKTFPVKYQGKTPLCKEGFKSASSDLKQLQAWNETFSNANIALPTGKDNGIFVVDVDGENGLKSLETLESQFGKLIAPTVITGKGKHIYFKYPQNVIIKNSVGKIAPNIDIRGEGGYVVIPPSIHENGNQYMWENNLEIQDIVFPEAPQWLLNLINNPDKEDTSTLQRYLDEIATAPQGTRNQTLLDNSRKIINYLEQHREIDAHKVVQEIWEAAKACGLPEEEIRQTIQNTLTFLKKKHEEKLFFEETDYKELDMSILKQGTILQEAPKMDLSIFKKLSQWVEDTAESTNTPVDYVAFALLAGISGIVGLSRSVSPWDNFVEYPCLFMGIVGNPSMGKTPAISPIKKLLHEVENNRKDKYNEVKRKWEGEKKRAEYNREKWEKSVKDNSDNEDYILPDNAIIPPKPQNYRFVFGDITQEALTHQLENNVKGAIVFRDELSGWLGSMNKYNFGSSDSHFWLECYMGHSYIVDRVKFEDNAISIPHLLVSIFGSIQPKKVVDGFLNTTEDGLVSRFLWAYPAPIAPANPNKTVDNRLVRDVFFHLDNLLNPYDPKQKSKCYSLDSEALDCFKEWRVKFLSQLEKQDNETIVPFLAKGPGTVLRLALIFELLWVAIDKPSPRAIVDDIETTENECVHLEAIQKAIALYEDYLIPMSKRVYECMYISKKNVFALSLAKWILENKPTTFRLVDIYYNGKVPHINDKAKAIEATKILVKNGWLKMWKRRQGENAGRPSVGFDVNLEIYQQTVNK